MTSNSSQSFGDWELTSPGEAGFGTDLDARLDALASDEAYNLHGIVIARGGKLVTERYYDGPDERWGHPLGTVRFTPRTLHDLRSITKSVVGLLYGTALAEGNVPAIERSLLDVFAEYAELVADPARRRITVADALSMQLGLKWDEDVPYSSPRNSEVAMEQAPDRCRYVLEQPVLTAPGTRWGYCGGATALLASLIVRGTGESLRQYAARKLFVPLGIETVDWVTGRDGVEVAASGLRMYPRDLAKLGSLVLAQGRSGGAQLVPAAWIAASLQSRARVNDDLDYGYHWWIAPRWGWVAAFGNGGQRMTLLPGADVVLVVTAGNYNDPDAWKAPARVLVDAVMPALNR